MTDELPGPIIEPVATAEAAELVLPGPTEAPAPTLVSRLWNRNFILLWQGQMVSVMGDVMYSIALGFWILARTGSTALMGSLMAAGTLARVALAPFAGVFVDRANRRWLMVAMDAVRGLAVLAVAAALLAGVGQVWMVFATAVVLGVCGAFFNPAVGSTLPDIVPKDRLVNANSAMAVVQTGAGLVGNPVGGFLYQALGAGVMFVANGVSYIVSAIAVAFMKIPVITRPLADARFFTDVKEGLRFVWQYRGIRNLVGLALGLNFFASMGIVLILPFFQRTPGLGPGLYGILMACFAAGLAAGFVATSIIRFPTESKFPIFLFGGLVTTFSVALMPYTPWFAVKCMLFVVGGATNAVGNSFISASLQAATPAEVRGRVFSLMSLTAGLMPLAMALAGVLAEFLPLRPLIAGSFLGMLPMWIMVALSRPVRKVLAFEPERDTIEAIR